MKILQGDVLVQLRTLPACCVDAIVTDPPYELGFMGKAWDSTGIAYNVKMWAECLRVLKPGGHLLSFGGSRTYHRMTCAIEDAGFQIRDQIMWLYASGFPKSLDVSTAIDKAARGVPQGGADPTSANHGKFKGGCSEDNPSGRGFGAGPGQFMAAAGEKSERELVAEAKQWSGWGTALKPAHEPIVVARKPIEGTVAANVLKHGTGALNIDGCRVGWPDGIAPEIGTPAWGGPAKKLTTVPGQDGDIVERTPPSQLGRWPANLIHDGSDEVLDAFPNAPGQQGDLKETGRARPSSGRFGDMGPPHAHKSRRDGEPSAQTRYTEEGSTNFAALPGQRRFDQGSAARFFYCAKTSKAERESGCENIALTPLAYGNQAQAEVKRGNTEHTGKSGINTVKMRGNNHPTVKPIALMRYLCRLVTPPGGIVLDPFTGSGSTGLAAIREGFDFIGIELSTDYVKIAEARLLAEVLS